MDIYTLAIIMWMLEISGTVYGLAAGICGILYYSQGLWSQWSVPQWFKDRLAFLGHPVTAGILALAAADSFLWLAVLTWL